MSLKPQQAGVLGIPHPIKDDSLEANIRTLMSEMGSLKATSYRPQLRVTEESESADTGTFSVMVIDPQAYATALYYRTKAGSGAWSEWFLEAELPEHESTHAQTVTLMEDHLSFIEWRLDFTIRRSEGSVYVKSSGFDRGKIPQVTVTARLDHTAATASATWIGDFDTASIKIAASTSGIPSATTVRATSALNGRNGNTSNLLTSLTPGQTVSMAWFGYSAIDGGGNESSELATLQIAFGVGSTGIGSLAILEQHLADAAVTRNKILAGAVNDIKIADLAITNAKVALAAIANGNMIDGAVGSTKLAAGAVVAGKVSAGAIDSTSLISGRIITGSIVALSTITGSLVATGTITGTNIAGLTITAGNINSGAITSDKISVSNLQSVSSSTGTLTVFSGGWIRSQNYSGGSAGWSIDSGSAEFNNVTIRGTLSGATGTFAGSLSSASGTFTGSLSGATGTFSGSLSAATGTFDGTLSASGIVATSTFSATTANFSGGITCVNAISQTGNFSSSFYGGILIPSNHGTKKLQLSDNNELEFGSRWTFCKGLDANANLDIKLSGTVRWYISGSGDHHAYAINGNWVDSSDARLKQHVTSLEGQASLDAIKLLQGVRYQRIESGMWELGFLAQSVQTVVPEAVINMGDAGGLIGALGMTDRPIVALLVEAMKVLDSRVSILEALPV